MRIILPLVLIIVRQISAQDNHKEGWCAMYDNCGKTSTFGSQLPCAKLIRAVPLPPLGVSKLEQVCGVQFGSGPVCCSEAQVDALSLGLKRIDPILSSCPACHRNFYQFMCGFTCLPNQSQFVNITKTGISIDRSLLVVNEMTQYVDPGFADEFFQSCKNVKFSATEGFAMDLIGGGATNYSQFLKFLGDTKPFLGGSPIQINYQYSIDQAKPIAGLMLRTGEMKLCEDSHFRCACTDCEKSCPQLQEFKGMGAKHTIFGYSYYIVWIMFIWLIFVVGGGLLHMYIARSRSIQLTEIDQLDELSLNDDNDLSHLRLDSKGFAYFQNSLITMVEDAFYKWATFCATNPMSIILVAIAIGLIISVGAFNLQFETDPVKLWVGPNEPVYQNQKYFENTFGEWFRVLQVIISSKNASEPVLSWETVQWWFEQELKLETLSPHVKYLDICFKPLGGACALESFTLYFDGDLSRLNRDTWALKLSACALSPINCLPSFQQPLKSNIIFSSHDPLLARAFTVTLLINSNSSDTQYTNSVIDYEHLFLQWALALSETNPTVNIAYSTEVSLSEELGRSLKLDIATIAVLYLLMFAYVSVALGKRVPRNKRDFVNSRIGLGLAGVFLVLLSVSSTLGIFSLLNFKATLLVAEVIPFLILAIGVDNIFLLVGELDAVTLALPQGTDVSARISIALQRIGPSCLASAALQIIMAMLGLSVKMPAVHNFALYSAAAVAINFMLQMTAFLSLLALDQHRLENGRLDCAPWIIVGSQGSLDNASSGSSLFSLAQWMRDSFVPWLFSQHVRRAVVTASAICFGISLSLVPCMTFGLDQRLAVPTNSYLVEYFDAIYQYLNVGPPIFVMMPELNLTNKSVQKQVCGKFGGCNEFLVANILEQEYRRSDVSTLASPASNWLDDFLTWLNPSLDECCRVHKPKGRPGLHDLRYEETFLLDVRPDFCSAQAPQSRCEACYARLDPPYDTTMASFPEGDLFMMYFNQWIEQESDICPLGGKAPYTASVLRRGENIFSSYLRTSHRPLRSQADFIEAYGNSQRITREIASKTGIRVRMYSPFYVFFAQYAAIVLSSIVLGGLALGGVWLVLLIVLGSLRAALILTGTVGVILVDVVAICVLCGVSLNGLMVVNLMICAGLAVEFTVHLVRAYMKAPCIGANDAEIRRSRAQFAICTVGPGILLGITGTKAIGIAVLGFAHSRIFEVYYFCTWASLIAVAAMHALVVLPVLLVFLGPIKG